MHNTHKNKETKVERPEYLQFQQDLVHCAVIQSEFSTHCPLEAQLLQLMSLEYSFKQAELEYKVSNVVINLFEVLHCLQHCTGHITRGSWKGSGNQYIQLVKVLYCKLPSNYKLSHLRSGRDLNSDLRGGR